MGERIWQGGSMNGEGRIEVWIGVRDLDLGLDLGFHRSFVETD